MKISCVALNSNLIHSEDQSKIIDYLKLKLFEIGERFSLISYFDNSLDRLKNIISDKNDIVFVLGTNDSIYNYNIKDNLSRIIGEKLSNNELCYNSLQKYCSTNNIVFSMKEESEVLIPNNSIALISQDCYNNGFMYKFNSTYIVFLPDNYEFAKFNYVSYILPLINDIAGINKDYHVIKCFGILEKDIRNLLNDYYNSQDFKIHIVSDNLDNSIYIRYNETCDMKKVQNAISNIVESLNKFIYSLEDVSIYDMARELLSIQHKSLAIGETITYGNITKELGLVNCNNIIDSRIFLNFSSMKKDLNIDEKVINQFGEYSVNSIYELSNSMLEKSSADNVLFVLADKNNPDICFIAVGDLDGIHVYKNKLVSPISIETISKTAIFYLIKKLKQNSLQFV